MVAFQILDCYSRDLKVIKETHNEKQVEYVKNEENEYSETVSKQPLKDKFEMEIHLFGSTTDGKHVHVIVDQFQPYFYVELPNCKKSTYTNFLVELQRVLRNDVFFDSIEKEYVKK